MLNTFALQIAKDRMTDLRRINWQKPSGEHLPGY